MASYILMGSSSSKVVTAWFASSFMALRRAGNVATNLSVMWTARGVADTHVKL